MGSGKKFDYCITDVTFSLKYICSLFLWRQRPQNRGDNKLIDVCNEINVFINTNQLFYLFSTIR